MTDTIAGHLVWLKGLKGFRAEKHPAGYQPPKDAPEPVARFPLNAEQYGMSILILEQRFAVPARLENEKAEAGS